MPEVEKDVSPEPQGSSQRKGYLARKVNKARWYNEPYASKGMVDADTVFQELRTDRNTLSVWRCSDTDEERLEVVLAFAAGFSHPSKLDLALLEEAAVVAASVKLDDVPGETPVADLKGWHTDLAELSATDLATVANLLASAVRNTARCKRYSEKQVVRIVADAVKKERVKLEDLQDRMRAAVQKEMGAA